MLSLSLSWVLAILSESLGVSRPILAHGVMDRRILDHTPCQSARQLGKSGHGIREGNLLSSNGRAKECPSSAFSGALVPLLSCLDHYVAGGPRGASWQV